MMFFSPGANVFQSTLPLRGATSPLSPVLDFLFISVHALHEESDSSHDVLWICPFISIHALHEESDLVGWDSLLTFSISIHALHEESDRPWRACFQHAFDFKPRSP